MEFRGYTKEDYEAVCDFLIELNRDQKDHVNWNWARFEWMTEHPEFDRSAVGSIGLWIDNGRVIGAAIYDMYFGEAFCGVLPEYDVLYPAILEYAYRELQDEGGLGIAICDEDARAITLAENAGFIKSEQTENVMRIALNRKLSAALPEGLRIAELDPSKEPYAFQWILWRGFDHGTDRATFEREDPIVPQIRRHLESQLSLAAVDAAGETVAYCCLWYSDKTDYAYLEPVCTDPSYRGKGVAKALIFEALARARALGAAQAYVLSDLAFYKKLGFIDDRHFTFYWKKP